MGKTLDELRIYPEAEEISDEIWQEVARWERFPKETVGRQLVETADSIGANTAEGYGRYHFREDINSCTARGAPLKRQPFGCAVTAVTS